MRIFGRYRRLEADIELGARAPREAEDAALERFLTPAKREQAAIGVRRLVAQCDRLDAAGLRRRVDVETVTTALLSEMHSYDVLRSYSQASFSAERLFVERRWYDLPREDLPRESGHVASLLRDVAEERSRAPRPATGSPPLAHLAFEAHYRRPEHVFAARLLQDRLSGAEGEETVAEAYQLTMARSVADGVARLARERGVPADPAEADAMIVEAAGERSRGLEGRDELRSARAALRQEADRSLAELRARRDAMDGSLVRRLSRLSLKAGLACLSALAACDCAIRSFAYEACGAERATRCAVVPTGFSSSGPEPSCAGEVARECSGAVYGMGLETARWWAGGEVATSFFGGAAAIALSSDGRYDGAPRLRDEISAFFRDRREIDRRRRIADALREENRPADAAHFAPR